MINKSNLKKKIFLIFVALILIFSYNHFSSTNKKDLIKVCNDYLTKKLFQKGTFSLIDTTKITFNDGNMAFIEVTGRSQSSNHPYIKVKLKAQKDSNDNWHIISKDEEPTKN